MQDKLGNAAKDIYILAAYSESLSVLPNKKIIHKLG